MSEKLDAFYAALKNLYEKAGKAVQEQGCQNYVSGDTKQNCGECEICQLRESVARMEAALKGQ